MSEEQRFLVDVGMGNLHFPIRALSRVQPDGQPTVAEITIVARIWQKFEPTWKDKFIQIAHRHRDTIGPRALRENVKDYYDELRAAAVRVDLAYPFFYEKTTPVSGERCLVRYRCQYSARISSIERGPKIFQKFEIPVITTYPASTAGNGGGLFAQLTVVDCEIETKDGGVFPEEVIEIVDRRALLPVYSFLTPEDQESVIQKAHSERKTSVVMTDEIKEDLAAHPAVSWYAVRCQNHGMLHSYSTFVATEKSSWTPCPGFESDGLR
jgi:GTP cyclohydrolase I